VQISIFNILGQRVVQLTDNNFTAGEHRINWDSIDKPGDEVASGLYFIRMQAESQKEKVVITRKLLLIR
jgi:flagellar hook assembly protein FlgD